MKRTNFSGDDPDMKVLWTVCIAAAAGMAAVIFVAVCALL